MDPATIFQRTESGRETIRAKSRKLTQSERLLLIIINGVTPYDVLRKEVWSLSEDRFDRALRKLLKEELIVEVLLPVPGQEVEQLDSVEVDRFLQQDPLDPVTIISFDPEDEFGVNFNPFAPAPADTQKPLPAYASGSSAAEASLSDNFVGTATMVHENSSAKLQLDPGAVGDENATLKSLARQLAQDKSEEFATFLEVPAPAPALASVLNVSEPNVGMPDVWREHSDENFSDARSGIQWVYWIALIGGISIIVLSLFFRTLK